jgi:hypothetical protein
VFHSGILRVFANRSYGNPGIAPDCQITQNIWFIEYFIHFCHCTQSIMKNLAILGFLCFASMVKKMLLIIFFFYCKYSILFFMEHTTTRPFCSKDKIRLAASSAFQQLPNFSAI